MMETFVVALCGILFIFLGLAIIATLSVGATGVAFVCSIFAILMLVCIFCIIYTV